MVLVQSRGDKPGELMTKNPVIFERERRSVIGQWHHLHKSFQFHYSLISVRVLFGRSVVNQTARCVSESKMCCFIYVSLVWIV